MTFPKIPPKVSVILRVLAWVAVFAAGSFHVFRGIGHESLWYDESYSLAVAAHPVKEIIPLIAKDSHPPLYFLMLRFFTLVFGRSEAAARSLSALGIIALAGLGFFPLKRLWGEWRGLLFSALVFLTPISIAMGQEARMYSWTAFFVAGAFMLIWAWMEGRGRAWLAAAAASSLAAAYCHYYGLLAVAFVWAIALVLVIARDRRRLVEFLFAAAIVLAGYAPWAIALAGQASRVARNFWIGPVTGETVLSVLAYPFGYKFYAPPFARILFFGAVAAIVYGFIFGALKKDRSALPAAAALLVFALTLGAAVLLSVLVRPILVERYMVSCLGLFLLALTYCLTMPLPSVQWLPVLVLYGAVNFGTARDIQEKRFNGPMREVKGALAGRVGPDDVFIHGSEHTFGVFCYYFPNNKHFLYLPEGFVPFCNHSVFAPAGSTGPYPGVAVPDEGGVWIINRPYDYFTVELPSTPPGSMRKVVFPQKVFTLPNSWFTVSAVGYRYGKIMVDGEKP
jgi:hypothetical protein